MFPILLLLFIFVPIIEIGLFIQVGGFLGLWPTIALVLITAFVGASLVRSQGIQTLMSVQGRLQQGEMPAQQILEGVMLAVAGVTSMVGLLESVTSWTKEKLGTTRQRSTILVVGSVTCLSVISVLSYNIWEDYRLLGMNFNELTEALYDKLFLPMAGLLVALFTGWFMHPDHSTDELRDDPQWYGPWRGLTRFVVVPAVAIILITGLI